jgi:magnesium transporter
MEIFVYRKAQISVEEGFFNRKPAGASCNQENLLWVDMEAPLNADAQVLDDVFHFHPLTIEDAVETRNHPKVESYNKYLFLIVHGVSMQTNTTNLLPMNWIFIWVKILS